MRRLLLIAWCFVAVSSCGLSCAVADESAEPTALPSSPSWPELATSNFIDEQIFGRLREHAIVPSALCDDATFFRRLTLITIGQLPTPADVRAFVADSDPQKRGRKIDDLLAHRLRAAVWATRFCEITGNSIETLEEPTELKPKRAQMWHEWLRRRFERNVPYDQLVRGIVIATSHAVGETESWIDREAALVHQARAGFESDYAEREVLDLYWRRVNVEDNYPVEQMAERIASSFLGVRINCARCHDHPFERWTQQDYRQFVSIFSRVRFDMSPELRARVTDRIEARRRQVTEGTQVGRPLPSVREVYLADTATAGSAGDETIPKALGGPELGPVLTAGQQQRRDERVALVDWLCDVQNPFFARNFVNRVWAYYFGRGLVEPLDSISAAEASPYAQLLDLLAADFIQHGYDIQRLERLITNSTSWQRSSEPNDTNRGDRDYFSRAYVRMPPAETFIDMWCDATGIKPDFGGNVPQGIHAVEIAASGLGNNRWDGVLTLFGRSKRTQTCDCETSNSPSIRQTLALMSDENLLADLLAGELGPLLAAGLGTDEIIDELFLRTLSRLPTDAERTAAAEATRQADDRRLAFEGLLWGLVNTQEFFTIH
jgi:hypothetical protein